MRGAVKELRLALGKSQTEFGALIHKSLPTIQRYEGVVAPAGRVLADLAALARVNRLDTLADLFQEAFDREVGVAGASLARVIPACDAEELTLP